VSEQPEPRDRAGRAPKDRKRSLLAFGEHGRRVEPSIDRDVVLDSDEELRELGWLSASHALARRPNASIGHSPEIGEHGSDASDLGAYVFAREVTVQQKIHTT
jgi:hypothetical protein